MTPDFIHLVTTLNMLILKSINVGINPINLVRERQNIRNLCLMQHGVNYPNNNLPWEWKDTVVTHRMRAGHLEEVS